jgi:hypothetical protein
MLRSRSNSDRLRNFWNTLDLPPLSAHGSPPRRDLAPGIEQILKPVHVQTFFPQPSVKALDARILGRLARLNLDQFDAPFRRRRSLFHRHHKCRYSRAYVRLPQHLLDFFRVEHVLGPNGARCGAVPSPMRDCAARNSHESSSETSHAKEPAFRTGFESSIADRSSCDSETRWRWYCSRMGRVISCGFSRPWCAHQRTNTPSCSRRVVIVRCEYCLTARASKCGCKRASSAVLGADGALSIRLLDLRIRDVSSPQRAHARLAIAAT